MKYQAPWHFLDGVSFRISLKKIRVLFSIAIRQNIEIFASKQNGSNFQNA